MADLILACGRDGRAPFAAERLRRAASRLAPPEAALREPLSFEVTGVAVAVANPTAEGVRLHPHGVTRDAARVGGVCVGGLFGTGGDWWRVGSDAPDGTYALLRWDADTVELLADICASRTLWYILTDRVFLASTSQRALVALLGTFELERSAVASFLVTGTLGPEAAWDSRVRRLPPDGRALLDRRAWSLTVLETPAGFARSGGERSATQVARLQAAISTTCGSLNIDADRWALPLSGGHDSRALLAFLVANGVRPRCVTWTTRAGLRNPLSDAAIARVLARRYRVDHEIHFLDAGDVDLDTVIRRFVAANEGRNDEIAGYLDGFALWRDLARSGVQGIIRGDESFGSRSRPMQPDSGRRQVGGATPEDYPEGHLVRALALAPQAWPPRLRQAAHEDLRDYRTRLSQHGYVPIILAGLNGAKARYVEIVNPHLSRLIIGTVRSLPPGLRAHARAFAEIVDGLDRLVPYARYSSTQPAPDLLASHELLQLVLRELKGSAMERILGVQGSRRVLAAVAASPSPPVDRRAQVKKQLRRAGIVLPTRLTYRISPAWKGPEPLPPAKLAFRAVLASRTVALFEEDAKALAVTAERPADEA